MATGRCPHCGGQANVGFKRCPNCGGQIIWGAPSGRPYDNFTDKQKTLYWIIVLLIVMLSIGWLVYLKSR